MCCAPHNKQGPRHDGHAASNCCWEMHLTDVAAGAVVTQNTVVESGTIYAGVPAKKVKDINQSDFAGEIERISNNYVMYSSWFKEDQ